MRLLPSQLYPYHSLLTPVPYLYSSPAGLDDVLEQLKGPKVLGTVAKSSMDWDNFKDAEGLNDDLATAAKDG